MDNVQKEEVNNLKKFGTTFQTKCLAILITDRAFLERIIDILSPDYFETDAHKWVVKLVSDYFPKYREMPTFEVFKVGINNISDPVLKAAVYEQVKEAYKQTSAKDITFIKEQFLDFCKNQKVKNAIFQSMEFLKMGDYESIKKQLDEALKAGMERNLGSEYFADFDQRMSESARETIKTNWDLVDGHLDGGLGKGDLGIIVAPPGSGKTWTLVRLGAEAVKQGKNVMHVTLELNEKYVELRYDSYFSGIPFQEVRKNSVKVKAITEEIKKQSGGQLFVKYFPPKTISAQSIKMFIERFTLIAGTKIVLLIVDYADYLKQQTFDKNSNLYTEGGSIYVELRSISGELQIPCWSASQCNRGSAEEDIIVGQGVADSYAKIMIADFIMSISRKAED
jgi:hypothetical protein